MKVETELFGGQVKIVSSTIIEDERGYFGLPYLEDEAKKLGLPSFVREIHSRSNKNVLRGLHFQRGMSKLMRVTKGKAHMVAIDIRPGSPTFLQRHQMDLSERELGVQIWASDGFARGFYAFEEDTEVQYKCSAYFDQKEDKAVRWDSAGIVWPFEGDPILSRRDATAPTMAEIQGRY